MPKTEMRYANDTQTGLEYAIILRDGEPVEFFAFGNEGKRQEMDTQKNYTIHAMDDDYKWYAPNNPTEERRVRQLYTLEIENGIIKNHKVWQHVYTGYEEEKLYPYNQKAFYARAEFESDLETKQMFLEAAAKPVNPAVTTETAEPQSDTLKPGERRPDKYNVSDEDLETALAEFSTDLTALAEKGQLDPVIGRERECREVSQLLMRKNRASVALTGEAGVGKSALVEALANRIAAGEAEEELSTARIVSLDMQAMTAGTKYRGDFEKRLMPIMQGLEERGGYINGQKVILFIDEIHKSLSAGQASEAGGAGEIMKPYLARGGITCIGATTTQEYQKYIEPDKALARRFQSYHLEEPNEEATMAILRGTAEGFQKHHRLNAPIADNILKYTLTMTEQFMPDQCQPDKSLSVIDDAAATARSQGRREVEEDDIIAAVSKATGLGTDFLKQEDLDLYDTLGETLAKRVIGQPGVHTIGETLCSARMGLTDDNAPRGSFILSGPTGVGKTETAKALADITTGDEENLIRIDMSKYQEPHSIASLIGAQPGYVGHDGDGELTGAVRKKPFSVVLIDEIEKAHKDVLNVFLSILDDGELKDNHGRNVDFRNTIFLFTTNLGADAVQQKLAGQSHDGKQGIGFLTGMNGDDTKNGTNRDELNAIFDEAISGHLPPELLNRFNETVKYYPLEQEHIGRILDIEIQKVEERLRHSAHGLQLDNVSLNIGQDVKDALIAAGYSKTHGARPLNRAVQKNLTNKLGRWMMRNKQDLQARNREGAFEIEINSIDENFSPRVNQTHSAKPTVPA